MDNITVNMENLTEEEREQLLKLIEKSNKAENEVWEPKRGEIYYRLYGDGSIGNFRMMFALDDEKCYSIGNYFKTKEEAKFQTERFKVLAEMKRIAKKDKEVEWNCLDNHYSIYFDMYDSQGSIRIANTKGNKRNDIYFVSKERAQECIDTIGEERLKKYYFQIKE